MKMRFLFLGSIILICIFGFYFERNTGKFDVVSVDAKQAYLYKSPDFERVSDLGDENLYYIVDKNTKIVYVVSEGVSERGISVVYNKDGTIMHESDLKKD